MQAFAASSTVSGWMMLQLRSTVGTPASQWIRASPNRQQIRELEQEITGLRGEIDAADSQLSLIAEEASDLPALRAAFDSNDDGILDAQDTDWASFQVWRDLTQDGVSDADPGHRRRKQSCETRSS